MKVDELRCDKDISDKERFVIREGLQRWIETLARSLDKTYIVYEVDKVDEWEQYGYKQVGNESQVMKRIY